MKFNLLCSLAFLTISVPAQEIYSWQDKNGGIKYSDKIPKYIKIQDVTKIGTGQKNAFKSIEQIARDEGKTVYQQQQELEKISKGNCDVATQNLKVLSAFKQITQLDSNGNEVILSDKEKAQQISLIKKQIEIFCS
jgi:Domain of unknown function (DUF4124)